MSFVAVTSIPGIIFFLFINFFLLFFFLFCFHGEGELRKKSLRTWKEGKKKEEEKQKEEEEDAMTKSEITQWNTRGD